MIFLYIIAFLFCLWLVPTVILRVMVWFDDRAERAFQKRRGQQ